MASEILIGFSFIWLIIWSIFGLKAGMAHPEWVEKMKSLSEKGGLDEFWSTYDGFRIQIPAHAHANNFACITFLIGIALKTEIIGYSSQFQMGLAIGFIIAMILAAIGERFRIVPVAAIGSMLFLAGLIVSFVGMFV
ncbi:MAG: hypothetical protein GXO74_02100 [Calditrichaeota bacterium]|nr:hypothetical protein [Calditrichota bacterium]